MKNIVLYIIVIITLVSCGPVKRHNRLVERYPYVHKDITQVVHDTTFIHLPPIKADGVLVKRDNIIDTLFIEKERLRVKVINTKDTIYVEGQCKEKNDTIVKEIIVPLYQSTPNSNKSNINWILILVFIVLFLIGVVLLLIKKRA